MSEKKGSTRPNAGDGSTQIPFDPGAQPAVPTGRLAPINTDVARAFNSSNVNTGNTTSTGFPSTGYSSNGSLLTAATSLFSPSIWSPITAAEGTQSALMPKKLTWEHGAASLDGEVPSSRYKHQLQELTDASTSPYAEERGAPIPGTFPLTQHAFGSGRDTADQPRTVVLKSDKPLGKQPIRDTGDGNDAGTGNTNGNSPTLNIEDADDKDAAAAPKKDMGDSHVDAPKRYPLDAGVWPQLGPRDDAAGNASVISGHYTQEHPQVIGVDPGWLYEDRAEPLCFLNTIKDPAARLEESFEEALGNVKGKNPDTWQMEWGVRTARPLFTEHLLTAFSAALSASRPSSLRTSSGLSRTGHGCAWTELAIVSWSYGTLVKTRTTAFCSCSRSMDKSRTVALRR